jgi:hypothetical protein
VKYKTGDRVWFLAKHLSAPQQAAPKEHDHTVNIDGFILYDTVKSQYGGSSRSCRVTVDGNVGVVTIGTRSLSAAAKNGVEARNMRDHIDIEYDSQSEEQLCAQGTSQPRASTAYRIRDRSKCEGGGLGKG